MAARGQTWSNEEVRCLIFIWSDDHIQQQLEGAQRNKPIFEKIAKKMMEMGHQRDEKQCREKVKNLRSKYRKVKDENSRSGHGKTVWKFMEELDKVLGTRPTTCPTELLDSMPGDRSPEHEDEELDDGSCSELIASSLTATVASTSMNASSNDANDVDDSADANEGVANAVETSNMASGSSKRTPEDPDTTPACKKIKVSKRESTLEKAMTKMMSAFAAYEKVAEVRFLKKEEEHRREERAHEERMMHMILQVLQSQPMPPQYGTGYPPYMPSTPLPLPQSQVFYDVDDSI